MTRYNLCDRLRHQETDLEFEITGIYVHQPVGGVRYILSCTHPSFVWSPIQRVERDLDWEFKVVEK
jgi:hypothetical protein